MIQLAFVNFRKGSYLIVEGKTSSDRFFIIQKGKVLCHSENDVPGSAPEFLGAGDFVGVVPCLSGHSQIEMVVALTDVVAISVRRDQYPDLIERNTSVALKIIRAFAKQMRVMNEKLTKLALNNVIKDSPEQIFAVASYYEKVGKPDIAIYGYYQYLKECPGGISVEKAKKRFVALKPRTHAVFFEPSDDLIRRYPKDTMFFSECQPGFDMFVIQKGKVKITKVVDENEVTLAVLKKGDMFGEMSLLENKPRSASAIAYDDCNVMVINGQNFNQMVATQSQLVASLTTMFAERLWTLSRQIANAQIQNPIHKLVDMLALQFEKLRIPPVPELSYQTDFTVVDIENMCGIPQNLQGQYIYKFKEEPVVKIVEDKIYIRDCMELLKQAAFYRKKKV